MYRRTTTPAVRGLRCLNGSSTFSCCSAPIAQRFSTTSRNGTVQSRLHSVKLALGLLMMAIADVRALFRETDNAELNKVLGVIQEKIIFPAYLPDKQKKIVFSPKKQNYLRQNPIVIELEGVEHRFEHINQQKDLPAPNKLLNQVLDAMETPADWDNLPTLLAGYYKGGINTSGAIFSGKVTRKATDKGSVLPIVECAKQNADTGFFIGTREQIAHLLRTVCKRVDTSKDNLERMGSAIKMADQVFGVLQRPDHVKQYGAEKSRDMLQFSATGRGLALYSRAQYYKALKDAGESTESALASLIDEIHVLSSVWAQNLGKGILSMTDFQELYPWKDELTTESKTVSCLTGHRYVDVLARNIRALEIVQDLARDHPEDFTTVAALIEQNLKPASLEIDSHVVDFLSRSKGAHNDAWIKSYEYILNREAKLA